MINANEYFNEKYPLIFPQSRDVSLCARFGGIECGAGWFNLLDRLCGRVQDHVDNKKTQQVVFEQVKEKFGKLRINYFGGDAYVEGLMDMAESISATICERCSAPAKLAPLRMGWLKTLCDECKNKFQSSTN